MKRFLFRLETVLMLRQRREDEVKEKLARKNSQIQATKDELRLLQNEIISLHERQKTERAGTLDVALLRNALAWRHIVRGRIAAARIHLTDLGAESEIIRKELVKATQKVKTVELLKEKQQLQWKKEVNLQEQKFIDDLSQQRYIRAHSALQKA